MVLADVTRVLGGRGVIRKELRSDLDLIELAKRGVTKKALQQLADFLGVSVSAIVELLPVSERTIQRYSPQSHFSKVVSEQILHIAKAAARGAEVFGEKAAFLTWMQQPVTALGNRTPMGLLGSRFGVEMVIDELGRIEHGVLS